MILKETEKSKRENRLFILALLLFTVILVYRYFSRHMTEFNTTIYAFKYSYGFISRALLGSIWALLDRVIPMEMMAYEPIYWFNIIATFFYIVFFFLFYRRCLNSTKDKNLHNVRYLIIFLTIFAFPIFLCYPNFGRIDIFLFMITLAMLMLLIKEKSEWLIIPFCIVAECLHHGFVFMNINIVLVLLLYKALMKEKKREQKKYFILSIVTFLLVSVFFLYFEFFSHAEGKNIYEEVVNTAMRISDTGDHYSKELVNHEILGEGVFMDEWEYHVANYIDTPIFLCFFFPYIFIAIHFFGHLLRGKTKKEKVAYSLVMLGAATVVPEMILKVDYGRYVYAVFFYYIAIVLCLIAMGDQVIAGQLEETKQAVKAKLPCAIILLVYPMIFMPLYDIIISSVDDQIRIWFFGGRQFTIY